MKFITIFECTINIKTSRDSAISTLPHVTMCDTWSIAQYPQSVAYFVNDILYNHYHYNTKLGSNWKNEHQLPKQ